MPYQGVVLMCCLLSGLARSQTIQPTALVVEGGQTITITGVTDSSVSLTATLNSRQSGSSTDEQNPPTTECAFSTQFATNVLCLLNFTIPTPSGYQLPSGGGEVLTGLTYTLSFGGADYPLTVYTAPTINQALNRTFTVWTTHELIISGSNLNLDGNLRVADYMVSIGNNGIQCEISGLSSTQLNCTVHNDIPSKDANGQSALTVRIGNFDFIERQLTYQIPYVTNQGAVYDYNPSSNIRLTIPGENFVVGVTANDYDIQIGQGGASGLLITPSSLLFFPPSTQPAPLDAYAKNGDLPQIIVTVPADPGSIGFVWTYTYLAGYVRYNFTTSSGTSDSGTGTSGSGTSGTGSTDTSSGTSGTGTSGTSGTSGTGTGTGTSDTESGSDSGNGSSGSNSNNVMTGVIAGVSAFFGLLLLILLICCLAYSDACGMRRRYAEKENEFVERLSRMSRDRTSYTSSRYPSASELFYISEKRRLDRVLI